MIRGQDALRSVLAEGETVSVQGLWEGGGFRLATTATGETVFRSALKRLLAKGEAVALATDLAGEPIQFGAPR